MGCSRKPGSATGAPGVSRRSYEDAPSPTSGRGSWSEASRLLVRGALDLNIRQLLGEEDQRAVIIFEVAVHLDRLHHLHRERRQRQRRAGVLAGRERVLEILDVEA